MGVNVDEMHRHEFICSFKERVQSHWFILLKKKKINYLSMNLTLFIYLCRSQNFIMMETSKLMSMCDHWLGVQINELHTTIVTMSMGLGSVLNNTMMVKNTK